MSEKNIILECDFVFKCPVQWENLLKLDNPDIRYCNSCEREVFYTKTKGELENNKRLGRCIAANVYDHEVFGYVVIAGGAKPIEEVSEDTTKLLVLGTEENRNEMVKAIKNFKQKNRQKQDKK